MACRGKNVIAEKIQRSGKVKVETKIKLLLKRGGGGGGVGGGSALGVGEN